MTDDIRTSAIEAACAEFRRGETPSWRVMDAQDRDELREAMTRAIGAYERAMWRPIAAAPEFAPLETSPEIVLLTDGRHVVRGRAGRCQFGAHAQPDSDAGWMPPASVRAFRPLPLPPEGEA